MNGAHAQGELRWPCLCLRKSSGTVWTKSVIFLFFFFPQESTCCGGGKPCSGLHITALHTDLGAESLSFFSSLIGRYYFLLQSTYQQQGSNAVSTIMLFCFSCSSSKESSYLCGFGPLPLQILISLTSVVHHILTLITLSLCPYMSVCMTNPQLSAGPKSLTKILSVMLISILQASPPFTGGPQQCPITCYQRQQSHRILFKRIWLICYSQNEGFSFVSNVPKHTTPLVCK